MDESTTIGRLKEENKRLKEELKRLSAVTWSGEECDWCGAPTVESDLCGETYLCNKCVPRKDVNAYAFEGVRAALIAGRRRGFRPESGRHAVFLVDLYLAAERL